MPTKTLRPLKPGDPCTVRLHAGEIVEAEYLKQSSYLRKTHYVKANNCTLVCGGDSPYSAHEVNCRFTTKPPAERT